MGRDDRTSSCRLCVLCRNLVGAVWPLEHRRRLIVLMALGCGLVAWPCPRTRSLIVLGIGGSWWCATVVLPLLSNYLNN